MKELVSITDRKAVTTSLIVSEVFEKRHCDVMRSVSRLECSDEFSRRNFASASYLDEQNKPRPMYQITRDGFSFLAMGFTGRKAAEFKERFIAEFNRMEQALLNGAGETKRVDVNMKHTRGITNPQGLDIKYTLDLTKIVQNPTRSALAVLERLTGMSLVDIFTGDVETDDRSGMFDEFYDLHCSLGKLDDRLLYKGLYEAFFRYASEAGNASDMIPSRKMFSRMLQAKGHEIIKRNGYCWIVGIEYTKGGAA